MGSGEIPMNVKDHGRRVTLLVWTLVAIGLVSSIALNAQVGWTLFTLNRERVLLQKQDHQLVQEVAQLQRLGQEIRAKVAGMLQGGEIQRTDDPLAELPGIVRKLQLILPASTANPALADLHHVNIEMSQLWEQTLAWRSRYAKVYEDLREKRTLNHARDILQRLRDSAESLEGRQRLQEARRLQQWRKTEGVEAAALADTILTDQSHGWTRVFKEVRTELADLSRLVETLAGENQLDHLADLRDNQLKPVLERLERQLSILADELKLLPDLPDLSPSVAAELRDVLFGRGHSIVKEYQTIHLGKGGLFRLANESLILSREKEALQNTAQQLFERLEAIHPGIIELAGEHSRALTRRAEKSLTLGLQHLSVASILLLGGFVFLGGVISKKVRQQITALAQLRRQNEMILNSAGEGILGLDSQGRTTFLNRAGERLLGWNSESVIGRDHGEILCFVPENATEQSPSAEKPVAAILNSGTAFHGEGNLFRQQDGNLVSVEYTASPISNDKGDIEGVVVTLLDITDRKETEAALQQSYREMDILNQTLEERVVERTRLLEDKNRQLIKTQEELVRKEQLAAVGSLAAGVAHEINNPTAIIRGNGEILMRKLSAESSAREEVSEILKNTERISHITQNMLIFAREQPINPEEVQINQLLLDVLSQVSHQAPCDKIEFVRQLAPELPLLAGDKIKLRQVLNNLVLNAIQAMEGEGTLTVATELKKERIEVRISDSGPGISTELKGRIFNPFFTTKNAGTGLGLSVSYGIVQAIGGGIDVESLPGQGATFIVRMPVC